jgi:sugar phosphate isomerase/epimerase
VKPLAIQLYSVREDAAKDFPAVLKKVADIGYKGVEFAGLQGMCPCEVRKIIDDLGLVACSSHTGIPACDTVSKMIDEANTLGLNKLISGPGGSIATMDGIMACVDKLNAGIALLEGSGLTFGLHNHWAEFEKVDGQFPEDILLEKVPGLFAQLDVYWIAVGGPDPVETVARLKSRAPLLHVKDGMIDPPQPHTAVGSGKLDMPAIVGAADPCVLEWLIVELDSCGTDMWEAVAESYRYLTATGLASGNK